MSSTQSINQKRRKLLINILTQEAKKKQAIVEYAKKNGKSKAGLKYGVNLSSVKRWCNRYNAEMGKA